MYTTLFYILIGIITLEFLVDKYLDYQNSKWRGKPIPKALEDIYDEHKYKKQQEYSKVNSKFSSLTSLISFITIIIFFFLYGFEKLNSYLEQFVSNPIILGLVFFGVLFFITDILSTPFGIYQTFVIEEKFGFNKTTPKTYILDKLKSYLISIVLGVIIYTVVYKLYELTQEMFWIYCWIFITLFMLFFTIFYSNIIVPLFNKQTPLPDGELKQAISEFADKTGFKIDNIYEIDGSKRSTRANAYFTGLGAKKRIVLYDTLIKDLNTQEIVAVLAHEIGHYKKKHTIKGLITGIIQTGLMLFVLSLIIESPLIYESVGVSEPKFHIGIVVFGILYTPVSTIISLFTNIVSRKNEYQADNFAAKYSNPLHLISALKKLAANSLSNLTPHPLYVFVNYSHPDIASRVDNLSRKK